MSKRKSILGVRKPIPNNARLVADQAKFSGTNDTFVRMVEKSERLAKRRYRVTFIECGHTAVMEFDLMTQWEPATWEECPVCRAEFMR